MPKEKSNFKSFVIGSFIGVAVGAVAVVLYLPQTGKKVRRQIKNKGNQFKRDLEKAVSNSKDIAQKVQENWSEVKKIINENPGTEEDKRSVKKTVLKKTTKKSVPPKTTKDRKTTSSRSRKKLFKGI